MRGLVSLGHVAQRQVTADAGDGDGEHGIRAADKSCGRWTARSGRSRRRRNVAVAAALNHRFILEEQAAVDDNDVGALDFKSETTPAARAGTEAPGGAKKPKRGRTAKEK